MKQGTNSKGQTGYLGPRPPPADAAHHYCFQVFALKSKASGSTPANRAGTCWPPWKGMCWRRARSSSLGSGAQASNLRRRQRRLYEQAAVPP